MTTQRQVHRPKQWGKIPGDPNKSTWKLLAQAWEAYAIQTEQERDEAVRLLQSLTPGGSELIEPRACADYVERRRSRDLHHIAALTKELQEAQATVLRQAGMLQVAIDAMEDIRTWLADHWGDGPIDGDDLSLVEADSKLEAALAACREGESK